MSDVMKTQTAPCPPFLPLAKLLPIFWPMIESDGHCWRWRGQISKRGYGVLYIKTPWGRKSIQTHRLALAIKIGSWPDVKMYACHTCRNKDCCNPLHIYAGDQTANMADMMRDGTHKTRWVKGHQARKPALSKEQAQEVIDLWTGPDGNAFHFYNFNRKATHTVSSLAKRFSLSDHIVIRIIRDKNHQTRPSAPERNEEIRSLFFARDGQGSDDRIRLSRGKWIQKALAERFNVTHGTILSVIVGAQYRDLDRSSYRDKAYIPPGRDDESKERRRQARREKSREKKKEQARALLGEDERTKEGEKTL